jgi:hypothetical protein
VSLKLVKSLYDTQIPLPHDEDFYHRALQDIELDGISSQVYFLLKQQGKLDQTPSVFKQQLKESYDKGLFQNLFIKNQTDLILGKFEDLGIDVIVLKGIYFAEKYFGHIGARATSDIDLLIRYQDLKKAIDTVKSLGFTVEEEQVPGHFHCSFSKVLPHSAIPLVVEIHWSLVKESTSNFDINDLWMQSIAVGQFSHIKELSSQHTFYMICLHGWRHNLDSMKYFLDIIQVIYKNREELDYEQIFTLADCHQTLKRMIRTLSIVYQQFPFLNEVKSLPYKMKTKWEYRSVTGFKQYADFIDYQFLSYDTVKHRLIEALNWIWPSQYEVYAQLDEHPKGYKMYLSLYKKRVTSTIKVFSHLKKRPV